MRKGIMILQGEQWIMFWLLNYNVTQLDPSLLLFILFARSDEQYAPQKINVSTILCCIILYIYDGPARNTIMMKFMANIYVWKKAKKMHNFTVDIILLWWEPFL